MQIDPQTGLLLPEALAKSRTELSERAERQARGKFFSQLGRAERYDQAGAQSKPPDEPSYRYLRDAYWESQIDQIIVARRQQQVRSVARYIANDSDTRVGWTIRHKNHASPRFKETSDIARRCAEVAAIIDRPQKDIHPGGFADVATIATEEELILDRKVMVRFKDRAGRPGLYYLIAGDTIKPIVRVLYAWIEEHRGEQNQWGPDMWDVAAESLSYDVGFDLTKAAWVQEIDGVITAAWAPDELDVAQVYPSVEINRVAYGRGSLFQRSMTLADLWISLIDYNRGLFSIDYPENALFLYGDYSPAGLEAFTRQLTSQVGNRNWQRLAVIPADPEFKAQLQKLRETPKDMVWPELMRTLVALKTAVYSMHPSEINMDTDGGSQPTLSERNQEAEIAYAKEEGFDALLHHQSDWFNRAIVWRWYDDLEMVWVNLHRETEQARIALAVQRVESYWTINEGRKQENLDPLPHPWADMPLPLALQAQQARQSPASQDAGRAENGDPQDMLPDMDPQHRPSADPAVQKSRATRIWRPHVPSATTPEGDWQVTVGGRPYRIEPTPYGTRYHGPNGGLLFQTNARAHNPEEAVDWLEQMLEGARS
jgi:hypothetical protein